MILTQTEVQTRLNYDATTGLFIVRTTARGRRFIGQLAGTVMKDGYIRIRIDNNKYLAHRLAFLYMTGAWPDLDKEVDHIDGDRANNAWTNLRLVTKSQQAMNRKRPSVNTSGYKNVEWSLAQQCWFAKVTVYGITKTKYGFKTPEAANEAAIILRNTLHVEYANHG